ncbi:MAG: hypothetical protein N3I35_06550 [Clostridia bacterium]|nr:hypothetical protein [Clostridia bacterium]
MIGMFKPIGVSEYKLLQEISEELKSIPNYVVKSNTKCDGDALRFMGWLILPDTG